MAYRLSTAAGNLADYASGAVFYSLPGRPAFPIRLTEEMFLRATSHLQQPGRPVCIYDPCCGSAYHLAVLAYRFWGRLRKIIVSDIDPTAVTLAQRNLGLLTQVGLEQRTAEIDRSLHLYAKPSHVLALQSAQRLGSILAANLEDHVLDYDAFQADGLDRAQVAHGLAGEAPDLVLSDLPYGQLSFWQGEAARTLHSSLPPAQALLEALAPALPPQTILVLASDKSQKIFHPAYQRLEHFKVGHRQVVILKQVLS